VKPPEHAIALLSEQTLWRAAMSALLGAHGFTRVADYATPASLLAAARLRAPDVLLVDLDNEHEDTLSERVSLPWRERFRPPRTRPPTRSAS
jgi:DNA-binding NarL/FixJ family response regulator